jgi:hypothetical protein
MTLHVHGWVEILSSTYESDYVDEREAVARIEDELRRGPLLGVRVDAENGAYMLAVSLVQNRELGVKEQLSQLLAFVAAVAPGSYGVVHLRDSDVDDGFTVYVVRRGRVTVEPDPFFSPAVPLIEDP